MVLETCGANKSDKIMEILVQKDFWGNYLIAYRVRIE